MSFNYGQYLRTSAGNYVEELTLGTIKNAKKNGADDKSHYYYDELNLINPETYYIFLTLNAVIGNVQGQLYFKTSNSTSEVTFCVFNLPTVDFVIKTSRIYNSLSEMKAAWNDNQVEDGEYCTINNSESDYNGHIFIKPSLDSIGTTNSLEGFPLLKTSNVEKVITLRTTSPITTLGYKFTDITTQTSFEYTGCNMLAYKVKELMNNSIY